MLYILNMVSDTQGKIVNKQNVILEDRTYWYLVEHVDKEQEGKVNTRDLRKTVIYLILLDKILYHSLIVVENHIFDFNKLLNWPFDLKR